MAIVAYPDERLGERACAIVVPKAGQTLDFAGMAAFLPDKDIGVVILWNSESSMPAALLPTALDRALGLPARDWLAPEPVRPRRRR